MKAAQVSDFWRRLRSRSFEIHYEQISFENVRRIGSALISFKPGMTAVVGGNGVGKSTLMSTIIRSLGPAHSATAAPLFDSEDVQVNGTLRVGPNHEIVATTIDGETVRAMPAGAEAPRYEWIDPSTYATKMQDLIAADAAFDEILEGIDARKYSADECEDMSYIVAKNYDHVEVYEVEYAVGVTPYFRVRADGIEYDNAQMGLGMSRKNLRKVWKTTIGFGR